MWISAFRVGSIPFLPTAPLPACIHDEMCIAHTCPEQPIRREGAASTVTDEFHHTGKTPGILGRQHKPSLDRMPAVATIRHIIGFNRSQTTLDWLKCCVKRKVLRFGKGLLP